MATGTTTTMSLVTGLEQLATAEKHVEEGMQRIAHMQVLISQGMAHGFDVRTAERALAAMEDSLSAMAEHRETLVVKVEAIHRA